MGGVKLWGGAEIDYRKIENFRAPQALENFLRINKTGTIASVLI